MNIEKWLRKNTHSLKNKTVAITGSTGGLGRWLCKHLALLGASLVLVDRNYQRSRSFCDELISEYGVSVQTVTADLSDILSVKSAAEELKKIPVDVFIHNAGAYDIPRYKTSLGYDNVYQINFISPYYIIKTILPSLSRVNGKVVVVGSIAHDYSKADMNDVDFSARKASSKVYGNAKRYLMFSLYELFKDKTDVSLSVTHPGISLTGITSHYLKIIFALIKYPMKIIFMSPKKACLPIIKGVFDKTDINEWIGPCLFDIWGLPKKKKINTCDEKERKEIALIAERIFSEIE